MRNIAGYVAGFMLMSNDVKSANKYTDKNV